jgi:hypothetical protein
MYEESQSVWLVRLQGGTIMVFGDESVVSGGQQSTNLKV